jgi:hypothetical protein
MKSWFENHQLAVDCDPRLGEARTLNERTAEWPPLWSRAVHEFCVLWNKLGRRCTGRSIMDEGCRANLLRIGNDWRIKPHGLAVDGCGTACVAGRDQRGGIRSWKTMRRMAEGLRSLGWVCSEGRLAAAWSPPVGGVAWGNGSISIQIGGVSGQKVSGIRWSKNSQR